MSEPLRAARWLNLLLATGLAVDPWVMDGSPGESLAGVASGLVSAALSLPRGPIQEQYGGLERWIR